MYSIASELLKLAILDPEQDQSRFGTRFCTGGYIFQIEDSRTGKGLLSGPTYPFDFVPVHGQGIPDTFNHIPLPAGEEGLSYILGIGKCDMINSRIVEPCVWEVRKESESSILFRTSHRFGKYDIYLERKVEVKDSVIESHTCVENKGGVYVPISWYPHPFFPPRRDNLLFKLSEVAELDIPTGFFSLEGGLVKRISGVAEEKSFQIARMNTPFLEAVIYTPLGYDCRMSTDYYSHFTPIWANDYTCSVEPYLDTTVFPGRKVSWKVRYEFLFS